MSELCPSADCLWQEGFYLWHQCLFASVFQSSGLFCLFCSDGGVGVHALGKASHWQGFMGAENMFQMQLIWNCFGLGQGVVCLQVGSKKPMVWVGQIWTKCCSCKPWVCCWKWTIQTGLAVSTSWAECLNVSFKINGKTPFGFKGGRSRFGAMLIFIFFNASTHSEGAYGRLETCASKRSTWLLWVGWTLQALLAGELPFLQSRRISEAQTQLLTLASDVCKDQFTVIAGIIVL